MKSIRILSIVVTMLLMVQLYPGQMLQATAETSTEHLPTFDVKLQAKDIDLYSRENEIVLQMETSDPTDDMKMAFANVDSLDVSPESILWSALEDFKEEKNWTLRGGEGHKYVYAKFVIGNQEIVKQTKIVVDRTPPIVSFEINDGEQFTISQTVQLKLNYSDNFSAVMLNISFDKENWSEGKWAEVDWEVELPPGDGKKDIYIKFRDVAGNEGDIISQSIELDTTPPTVEFSINNGANITSSPQVRLNIFATDANEPLEYRQANEDDQWTNWSDSPELDWELTAGDGVKTVKLEVRDSAGNVTALSKEIILDIMELVITGVEDGGIYKSDVVISFNKGTAKLNNVSLISNMIVSQEGVYKLIVTDWKGKEHEVNFVIDKTAPSGSITINNEEGTTNSTQINLSISAFDQLGNVEMRLANENDNWSDWQPYTSALTWTLPNGNGQKKVLLELRDEAGNIGSFSASILLSILNPPPYVPDPPSEVEPVPTDSEDPDQSEDQEDPKDPGTEDLITLSDIAGHWAESYIKKAVASGIVNGYSDGTFKPDASVSRAEIIVMLMRVFNPNIQSMELSFVDQSHIGSWAKKAIAYAVKAQIVFGYSDGYFRPNAAVTRAEMMVIVARALGLPIEHDVELEDNEDIPKWAAGAVATLRGLGLMQEWSGNPFIPGAVVTRAEAVKIMLEVMQAK